MGEAWRQVENIGSSLKAGLWSAGAGVDSMAGGLLEQLEGTAASYNDPNSLVSRLGLAKLDRKISSPLVTLIGDIRATYTGLAAGKNAKANATRPMARNSTEAGLYSGFESVPQNLAALVVGFATRNPETAAGMMALPVAGNEYGKARAKGLSPDKAMNYAVMQGSVEYLTEKIPASRLLGDVVAKSPLAKTIMKQLVAEVPGEQVATFLQDMNEWATLNPDKSVGEFIRERPEAAYQTLIATAVGTGSSATITTGAERLASAGSKLVARVGQSQRAQGEGAALDRMAFAAAESKVRARDPAAYADLIAKMTEESATDTLFVPADKVAAYMQMDGYAGEFDSYRDAVSEGLASGGDVPIALSDAMTDLAGTPAWDAVRDDIRLSPGGMSPAEARSFDASLEATMAELSDSADVAEPGAREALHDSISTKLMDAGFTPSTARTQAEMLTARYATRADRLGQDLTGQEFDAVAVRQVLPERLAAIRNADALDSTIDRMRGTTLTQGPSLLDWISKNGGIADTGGDVASMGGDRWHRDKPGRRKLLRQGDGTGSMLGGSNENGLDALAMRAWEQGYLPEFVERPTPNDLLDVIRDELHGTPRFAEGSEVDGQDAADDLRALLDERGVDPDKATRKEVRAAMDAYSAERMAGDGLDQSYGDGPRGRISFPADGFATGPATIELFKQRDLSTFIHETGHLFLEELRFDATTEGAPDTLAADWQTVRDWFDAQGHGVVDDGMISVEAHELWARGFERFVMEGKSPTPALRRAFEAMKSWLVNVYRSVSRLNAPISDDVRGVMQRLMATDQEIADAAEVQSLDLVFADATQAGMGQAEFAALQAASTAARGEANDAVLKKAMAPIRARVTAEYKERAATIRTEEAESVDAMPVFKALRLLKGTTLNSGWVRDAFGPEATSALPARVPPIHGENGVYPHDVAEMAGFGDARDMVEALMGVEIKRKELRAADDKRSVREALIQERTDAIMAERYGDPFNDGSIEEEALAAVHNDAQGEVMAAELRVLGRRTGKTATAYRIARQWARGKVRDGTVKDMANRSAILRYQRTAAKEGKAAFDAVVARSVYQER